MTNPTATAPEVADVARLLELAEKHAARGEYDAALALVAIKYRSETLQRAVNHFAIAAALRARATLKDQPQ